MAMKPSEPPPRTIGYSNADKHTALKFFFGGEKGDQIIDYDTNQHAATDHFPDQFKGKSTKLMTTLNNLVLKSPEEWQTQIALPFVQTPGITVEWDEIIFDVRIMAQTPVRNLTAMSLLTE